MNCELVELERRVAMKQYWDSQDQKMTFVKTVVRIIIQMSWQ